MSNTIETILREVEAYLSMVYNHPVGVAFSSFDEELILTIEQEQHPIPLPLDAISHFTPKEIAADLALYLAEEEVNNTAFSFDFTEYRRWVAPGGLGKLRENAQDSSQYDRVLHCNAQLHAALERLIGTGEQESVILPRTLRTLHQMAMQQRWQRAASTSVDQGFFDMGTPGCYPCTARWDQAEDRVGWMLSSQLDKLHLTEQQKQPVLSALQQLNEARTSVGLPPVHEQDIQLCTCHDIGYGQFQNLVPALSRRYGEKLWESARMFHAIHVSGQQGASPAVMKHLISAALPSPGTQEDQRIMAAAQQFSSSPCRSAAEWADLSFSEQWHYLNVANSLLSPIVTQEVSVKIIEQYEPPTPSREALPLEAPDNEPDFASSSNRLRL